MRESTGFGQSAAGPELSSADLLRECGLKLTDAALWRMFQERFHRLIATYVIRTLRVFGIPRNPDLVCDLLQDTYLRLLQNGGRALSGFLGNSDFSVQAFLGRAAMRVVADYQRSQQAGKRQAGEVISFEEARRSTEVDGLNDVPAGDLDVASILSWIDVQRLVESDPDRKHARRNILVFKLHYIEGLTPEEISDYPGFDLTRSSAEKIIKNLRLQLQKRIGQ